MTINWFEGQLCSTKYGYMSSLITVRRNDHNMCYIFILNHWPPLVFVLSFAGTVRSQRLQEHTSGLKTSQNGQ